MASIWLDGNLILENVGLRLEPVTIMRRSPGMITYSVEGEPDSMVFIDDLEVKVQDHETKYNVEKKILNNFWQRLFIEDFEGYESENELKKSGGWAGLQWQRGVAEAIYPSDYSGRVSLLMQAYQEGQPYYPARVF